jgi:phosphoglycolate phosphatase-like HAD superfamily hydrolase
MTLSPPRTLALDFDGVLCDGLLEYFQATWQTYRQVWSTSTGRPPMELAPVFYRLRPVIETGWEMPVLLRAMLKGFSEAEILAHWQGVRDRIIAEEDLNPKTLAVRVDAVRDQWIATDLEGWLDLHRFYEGVTPWLQAILQAAVEVFIITTKEGRFVQQLLNRESIQIPSHCIFGKECRRSKYETLRWLKSDAPAPIWMVEDRLPTLQTIQAQTDLEEVGLFLADWGYNTAQDRTAAFQDQRIQLLSLPQFVQDFSAWT